MSFLETIGLNTYTTRAPVHPEPKIVGSSPIVCDELYFPFCANYSSALKYNFVALENLRRRGYKGMTTQTPNEIMVLTHAHIYELNAISIYISI